MGKAKSKVYPCPFQELIRECGHTAHLLWEIPGPQGTEIAWLSCYAIGTGIAIVETFRSGGFCALTDCRFADTAGTITEVLDRCFATTVGERSK